MCERDINELAKIRGIYEKKLGVIFPPIRPGEVLKWIKLFQSFWMYTNRRELAGDTTIAKKISAVLLMRAKGIHVPDVVYELILARRLEITS